MKKFWSSQVSSVRSFAISLALCGGLLVLLNIRTIANHYQESPVEQVTFQEVQRLEKVIWVDARSWDAYQKHHYPQALWVSEDDWENGLFVLLENWLPDQAIVVYCDSQTCNASKQVAERLLSDLGIEKIYVLTGGYQELLKYL